MSKNLGQLRKLHLSVLVSLASIEALRDVRLRREQYAEAFKGSALHEVASHRGGGGGGGSGCVQLCILWDDIERNIRSTHPKSFLRFFLPHIDPF